MKQLYAATLFPLLTCAILIGSFAGCKVIDPAEDIPSYIHIDAMSLQVTNPSVQGSSRTAITEAWIFMDGALIGGFELPCTVPILAEGSHRFVIRGGVKMNGLTSTRAIYSSWKGWENNVTLIRGQQVTVSPVVTYFPALNFSTTTWLCNFDSQGTNFNTYSESPAILVYDSLSFPLEGNAGKIHLTDPDSSFFVGGSYIGYYMSPVTDVWLEFDYKSDCEFTVGIENTVSAFRIPWVTVQPNEDWTKIYVRLTDVLAEAAQVSADPGTTPYKIYFAMANPTTQSESTLYLDNIKLLK